jgi:hypothetical protein
MGIIKKYLTESFELEHAQPSLQVELNSVRIKKIESVNEYTNRVEKLYYKLCDTKSGNIKTK